uniref:Uncharacterized protein n=1 Tax=Ceratitis capitata TaxID=7213 RepID=W8BFL6_CERCA
MFKATSTCGSLKVRLRRLTEAEINAAQNEVQDTESETSTVEFIIHTGETTSDSDSDGETFGMVRAPTPIVISSDEEEEIRRGEIDITEENSQRPGDGYTEYTHRVTMTMKILYLMTASQINNHPNNARRSRTRRVTKKTITKKTRRRQRSNC